ncbi:hypothetical protein HT031_004117 [Scenedesmus sp. PABB004]|nr:hypothetical protein HT031_004117 [Scenedesmus sp. PABB004]
MHPVETPQANLDYDAAYAAQLLGASGAASTRLSGKAALAVRTKAIHPQVLLTRRTVMAITVRYRRVARLARSSKGTGGGAAGHQQAHLSAMVPADTPVHIARQSASASCDEARKAPLAAISAAGGSRAVRHLDVLVLLAPLPVVNALLRQAGAPAGARELSGIEEGGRAGLARAFVALLIGAPAAESLAADARAAWLAIALEERERGAARAEANPNAVQLTSLPFLITASNIGMPALLAAEAAAASEGAALAAGSSRLALVGRGRMGDINALLRDAAAAAAAGGQAPPLAALLPPQRAARDELRLPAGPLVFGALVRVSTEAQVGDGESFLRQYAAIVDATVVITGRGDARPSRLERLVGSVFCPPGEQLPHDHHLFKVLQTLASGGCNVILAMHQDRLARGGLEQLCAWARERGVALCVAQPTLQRLA